MNTAKIAAEAAPEVTQQPMMICFSPFVAQQHPRRSQRQTKEPRQQRIPAVSHTKAEQNQNLQRSSEDPTLLETPPSAGAAGIVPKSTITSISTINYTSSHHQQEQEHDHDHDVPTRIHHTIDGIPAGALGLTIFGPQKDTQNHPSIKEISEESPLQGKVELGDWIVEINGVDTVEKKVQFCANLLRSTMDSNTRSLTISRAVPLDDDGDDIVVAVPAEKENASPLPKPQPKMKDHHGKTPKPPLPSSAAAAAALKEQFDHQPPTQRELWGMTVEQLREEFRRRGWPGDHSVDKDAMLEDLGVPVLLWKGYRKLTVPGIKDLLRAQHKKLKGTKMQLLQRLGVPSWFLNNDDDETGSVTTKRPGASAATADNNRHHHKKLKTTLTPHLDPAHVEYELPCCATPRFDCLGAPPAGGIWYDDGTMTHVWHCLACGRIPPRPNAPPVEEFVDDAAAVLVSSGSPAGSAGPSATAGSDDDDDDDDEFHYYGFPSHLEEHIHHYDPDNGDCAIM